MSYANPNNGKGKLGRGANGCLHRNAPPDRICCPEWGTQFICPACFGSNGRAMTYSDYSGHIYSNCGEYNAFNKINEKYHSGFSVGQAPADTSAPFSLLGEEFRMVRDTFGILSSVILAQPEGWTPYLPIVPPDNTYTNAHIWGNRSYDALYRELYRPDPTQPATHLLPPGMVKRPRRSQRDVATLIVYGDHTKRSFFQEQNLADEREDQLAIAEFVDAQGPPANQQVGGVNNWFVDLFQLLFPNIMWQDTAIYRRKHGQPNQNGLFGFNNANNAPPPDVWIEMAPPNSGVAGCGSQGIIASNLAHHTASPAVVPNPNNDPYGFFRAKMYANVTPDEVQTGRISMPSTPRR